MKFGDTAAWRLLSYDSWICRIIWSWSQNNFETFENIRKNSKSMSLCVVPVEAHKFPMSCYFSVRTLKVFSSYLGLFKVNTRSVYMMCMNDNYINRRKFWSKPGHTSISSAKPNIHIPNLLLLIWRDSLLQFIIISENETKPLSKIFVAHNRYVWANELMIDRKIALYELTHDEVILQQDNMQPHVTSPMKTYLENLKLEVQSSLLY